jgi:hypothetical protein
MTDNLVTWMEKNNIPLTRERYLNLAYPEGEPDEWSAEQESMLPTEIQWDMQGPVPVQLEGFSIAQWAHYFSNQDLARIDTAIRSGLIAGLDNTEIARKVIGSLQLLGIDGVTEITRRHITSLGRIAIFPRRRMRKPPK